jgi:hypothetical protein
MRVLISLYSFFEKCREIGAGLPNAALRSSQKNPAAAPGNFLLEFEVFEV